MKKTLLFLMMLVSTVACSSEEKLDASSESSLQKSIAAIMKELSASEQKDFEQSIKIIMFSDVDNIMDLAVMGQNAAIAKGVFQAKVDGKTAHEIIVMATQISASHENTKPVNERAGVPVSAEEFLLNNRGSSSIKAHENAKPVNDRAGVPVSAEEFLR